MLVKVASCKDAFEGEVVKGMLSANGVECYLQNETMSQIYGGIPAFAINVLVQEEDVEKARELLASRTEEKVPEDVQCEPKSIKRILWEALLFTIFIVIFFCLISWLAYGLKPDFRYVFFAIGIFLTYFISSYRCRRPSKKGK